MSRLGRWHDGSLHPGMYLCCEFEGGARCVLRLLKRGMQRGVGRLTTGRIKAQSAVLP